ncbi:MAG TPA: extracellular solute-binding protein [Chloroflexota bacterium]|nr:extracellular solute-binding protein [Chloroflexota bacterium]
MDVPGTVRTPRSRRWLLSSLTAAPAAGMLAGACGPTSEPAKGPQTTGQKMTLSFWTWFQGDHYEDNLKSLIAKFQGPHPNVEVKYESLTWQEGSQKVAVQLAAGEPPDVMFAYFNPDWIETGYVMDIDRYLTREEREDFGKPSLDGYAYKGKIYGFPIWKQLWNVSANKELLDEAGIDYKKIQQEGWDFEQFAETAKKLTKERGRFGKKQWGFVYNGTWSNQGLPEMWQLWNMNSGMKWPVDEKGTFLYNDPRALDNLRRIISYSRDLAISPPENPAIENARMVQMFNEWDTAMIARSGPYIVPQQRLRCENIKAGKEEGTCITPLMLPFPHLKGEKEGTSASVPAHIVFKGKTDKGVEFYQTAVEFARFLSSAEGTCRWSADLYEVPARNSGIKYCADNGLLDMNDPNMVFFKSYFDRAAVSGLVLGPELSKKVAQLRQEAIFPNYEAALLGSKSAEQAFRDIVSTADRILKQP